MSYDILQARTALAIAIFEAYRYQRHGYDDAGEAMQTRWIQAIERMIPDISAELERRATAREIVFPEGGES